MNLFSPIFYLSSIFLALFSIYIADDRINYNVFINYYSLLILFSGFTLTWVNFGFKEIFLSFKTVINNKYDFDAIKKSEMVINNIWNNIFNSFFVGLIAINVILFSNPQKYSIGLFLTYNSSLIMYIFIFKTFVYNPATIFLKRKLIYLKRK